MIHLTGRANDLLKELNKLAKDKNNAEVAIKAIAKTGAEFIVYAEVINGLNTGRKFDHVRDVPENVQTQVSTWEKNHNVRILHLGRVGSTEEMIVELF